MSKENQSGFEKFQEEFWEWYLREYPELSTWTGDNRYNDRFTDLSWAAIERRHADERQWLAWARGFDTSGFSEQDLLSHTLFAWTMDLSVKAQRFPPVLLLTQIYGPHLDFAQLISLTPFGTTSDYRNYEARMAAFPAHLDQVIELLRRGIAAGWVLPSVALKGVPDQITGQLTGDIKQSAFYKPLEDMPDSISPQDAESLRSGIARLISGEVFPALKNLRDFVVDTYLPAGEGMAIAASELPDGGAYYAHCVFEHTTLGLTAEEIHETGKKEVERIGREMRDIMRQTGFEGSLEDFSSFLRTDPRFYFTDENDLVTAYRDIAKRADPALPGLFAELPRNPYGVRAFPEYEAKSQTTAMYYPGASDGSRAGYFMVNTYCLDMRPKFEMEALVLHEAVPGHHLQIARAQELRSLTRFRRNVSFTAYVEGWALYAERLGYEMGFYRDPYSKFGQLMYEMWRACRLVVDTGIHSFGWGRQQAIDYMKEQTAKTEQDIAVEVDRYIVMPGQALAYKIGELRIRQLRDRAERELGPVFNIRSFHNAVLDNGALPLPVLEEQIDAWIEAQRS